MSGLVIFAVIALMAWIYLIFAHGGFWRASQRLEDNTPALESWPEVVAIIPARNEADVIATTVASHMASTYRGRFSLIVVDDQSSDGTAEIAADAARGSGHRFEIMRAPALEPGWTGKMWALAHGLAAVREIAPAARYVLFTDADIAHASDTLTRLVAKAETDDRALVSLMARLDGRGPWAGLLIPAFVFFFQKLYPFDWANDPGRVSAAAAGGCALVRRNALEAAGGLVEIRGELIDDCALARLIKGNPTRRRIWLGLTEDVVSLRDNRPLSSIWRMVSRTAFVKLDHSSLGLIATLVGLAVIYLAGPFAVLSSPWHDDTAATMFGGAVWILMAAAYRPTATLYGQPWYAGAALPIAVMFYMAMTLNSAIRHWLGTGGAWKGRTYSDPRRRARSR